MIKNILIVHYNTPELTSALIKSINKFTPDCKITIFDNSDKYPLPSTEGVTILDNTKGQLINFQEILNRHPNKPKSMGIYGSMKHAKSIDYMFDILDDGFLLMDSDILLKKDISTFFNPNVIFAGHINKKHSDIKYKHRILPYICWINVPICKQYGIHYFDETRILALNQDIQYRYDTGASFLEDCIKTGEPTYEINIWKYIVHFGRASWDPKNDLTYWLKYYSILYD